MESDFEKIYAYIEPPSQSELLISFQKSSASNEDNIHNEQFYSSNQSSNTQTAQEKPPKRMRRRGIRTPRMDVRTLIGFFDIPIKRLFKMQKKKNAARDIQTVLKRKNYNTFNQIYYVLSRNLSPKSHNSFGQALILSKTYLQWKEQKFDQLQSHPRLEDFKFSLKKLEKGFVSDNYEDAFELFSSVSKQNSGQKQSSKKKLNNWRKKEDDRLPY